MSWPDATLETAGAGADDVKELPPPLLRPSRVVSSDVPAPKWRSRWAPEAAPEAASEEKGVYHANVRALHPVATAEAYDTADEEDDADGVSSFPLPPPLPLDCGSPGSGDPRDNGRGARAPTAGSLPISDMSFAENPNYFMMLVVEYKTPSLPEKRCGVRRDAHELSLMSLSVLREWGVWPRGVYTAGMDPRCVGDRDPCTKPSASPD